MKRILLYISFIIVFSECVLSQSDSLQLDETNKFYSADNIMLYADYLWQEADYIRSAGEYQRYLFTKSNKREMYALSPPISASRLRGFRSAPVPSGSACPGWPGTPHRGRGRRLLQLLPKPHQAPPDPQDRHRQR